MSQHRRTLLKTVGAFGAASLVPTAASARSNIESSFDLDGGRQEALVVFDDNSRIDALDALDAEYHAMEVLPIAFARLTGEQIETVASLRSVRRVAPNRELEYFNDNAREATGVEALGEMDDLDYTGEGIHAVVVDSGIDGSHPDLAENLQHNYRYVDPIDDGTMWVDVGPGNSDDNGHGTHVSGSVGGTGEQSDGQYTGMAPDVDLTVYSAGVSLAIVQAVGAFDHMLANHADAQLVTNSYGTSSGGDFDPNDPLNVATWEAYRADILPLFSAGNSGESCLTDAGVVNCERAYNQLNNYVKAPYVLGVAATDNDEAVTDFSSRGRREDADEGGPEGAHYDRDAAMANFRAWLEADDPTDTDEYGSFEASGVVGGAVAVGLVQTTDTFSLPADDLEEFDAYRVDAELTWEPSNPEGTEPNSYEIALETADGDEVASSSDDSFTEKEDNETELVVEDLAPGEYQFAITGWRGAGEWDLTADLELATYDDDVDGPLGIYRPGVGAPGSGVMSTLNPAHPLQALGDDTEVFYGALSGTSMSCPVTAGIAALVYEAHEDEHGEYPDPGDAIRFIEDSAELTLESHTEVNIGEGFVDAVGAVENALGDDTVTEAPDLEPIPDQEVRAGETVEFDAVATPEDVTLSASNRPEDATFTDHGDGTGEFVWETGPGDNSGSPYVVTVTASNDAGTDSQDVEIVVDSPRGNPDSGPQRATWT